MREYEAAIVAAGRAGDLKAVSELNAAMMQALKDANPAVDLPPDAIEAARREEAKTVDAGEALLIGAGRTADKIRAGVKQGFLSLPSYPLTEGSNQAAREKLSGEQAEADAAYAPLQKERPFATTFGEAAPYIAAPASAGVLPAAATVGFLEATKHGTPEERARRGATGFLTTGAGGLLAKAAGKFIAPVTKKAAGGAHQGALKAAERLGVKPRLSEATGSNYLRRLEDLVSQLPGGGGVMAEHQAGNALALNRAAARAIGETAEELTPEVFDRAASRIGQVFENIKGLGGKAVQIGPKVAAAADDVLRTQAKMLPHQQDQNLINLAKQAKWAAANRGWIDGETYQLMRSGLSDAAFDASVGTNKQLYGKLLEAIDDSAEASLRASGQGALADALKTARPQWANLKTLEKGLTVEGGNVSPARVAATMRTNNPGAFRRGRFVGNEMGDLATVGEGLKPLREGSQTFGRSEANPLTAGFNAAWSYPTAKFLTSPVVTLYPRTLGKTAAARGTAQLLEPTGRAAVAAALQQAGILPMLPVAAE